MLINICSLSFSSLFSYLFSRELLRTYVKREKMCRIRSIKNPLIGGGFCFSCVLQKLYPTCDDNHIQKSQYPQTADEETATTSFEEGVHRDFLGRQSQCFEKKCGF